MQECAHCFCSHCGAMIPAGMAVVGADDTIVCDTCYDRYYFGCNECGNLVHCEQAVHAGNCDEDGSPVVYCQDCAAKLGVCPETEV